MGRSPFQIARWMTRSRSSAVSASAFGDASGGGSGDDVLVSSVVMMFGGVMATSDVSCINPATPKLMGDSVGDRTDDEGVCCSMGLQGELGCIGR